MHPGQFHVGRKKGAAMAQFASDTSGRSAADWVRVIILCILMVVMLATNVQRDRAPALHFDRLSVSQVPGAVQSGHSCTHDVRAGS